MLSLFDKRNLTFRPYRFAILTYSLYKRWRRLFQNAASSHNVFYNLTFIIRRPSFIKQRHDFKIFEKTHYSLE